MLPGPVFNAELLTSARRARYFAARTIYGLILLIVVWQNDPALSTGNYAWRAGSVIREMNRLGQTLFTAFLVLQSIAILLLTPALVAGVIADEKQRKTLSYLLASPLSSAEIVVGKLAARMLHIAVFVAIGFPVLSLLSLFGGVDPLAIALSFVVTLTTSYFVAAMSILISIHARRPREAISMTYMAVVVWLLVPSLIPSLMPSGGRFWYAVYEWIKPLNDWVAPTSPFHGLRVWLGAMGSVQSALNVTLWMIGLQLTHGTVLLLLAVLRLRPVARGEASGSRAARLARGFSRARRFLPRPPCGDDAMMWKERFVARTSVATKAAIGLLVLTIGSLLGYITYDFAKPAFVELWTYGYGSIGDDHARTDFNAFLRALCPLIYVVWILGVASAASAGLTSEREEDTWTSLVATPLDGVEIIRAKMFGAVWGTRGVGVVFITLLAIGVAAGAVHPFGFVTVIVETTAFVWFVTALATYLSLRSRRSGRALVATIATLVLLNGGYLLACIPLRPSTWLIAVGVTPIIEAMSLTTYGEVRQFFVRDAAWGRSRDAGLEALLCCFLSGLLYFLGAAFLTLRACRRFDGEVDRPRRTEAVSVPVFDESVVKDEEEDDGLD